MSTTTTSAASEARTSCSCTGTRTRGIAEDELSLNVPPAGHVGSSHPRPVMARRFTVVSSLLTLTLSLALGIGGHHGVLALAFRPVATTCFSHVTRVTTPVRSRRSITTLPPPRFVQHPHLLAPPLNAVGGDGGGDDDEDGGTTSDMTDVGNGKTTNEKKNRNDYIVTNNNMKAIVETNDEKKKYNPLFPPMEHYVVEDVQLLFFDVILLLNLTLSISFWVVHRLQFSYLGGALSEGSLLALLWIGSGLYHGSFLYSASEGGNDSVKEERTGPGAAGVLAVNTMVTAASLRLIVALVQAVWEHRYALVDGGAAGGGGESLIPMELGAGFVLMGMWRALHSQYVRRW